MHNSLAPQGELGLCGVAQLLGDQLTIPVSVLPREASRGQDSSPHGPMEPICSQKPPQRQQGSRRALSSPGKPKKLGLQEKGKWGEEIDLT